MVVALGSVLGTIEDVVDELRDGGRAVGALGITCFRPWPLAGGPRGAAPAPSGWWSWRRRSRSAPAESSARTSGTHSPARRPYGVRRGGRARRPAGHPQRRCAGCSTTCSPSRLDPAGLHFLDLTPRWSSGSSAPDAEPRVRARTRRTCCATSAASAPVALGMGRQRGVPGGQALPGRHLRGRQPAARPGAAHRAGAHGPLQRDHLGPPRLPGLRRGARRALRARRRDARHRREHGRGQRHRLPRGVLHAVPRVVVAGALAALAVRQRPGRGQPAWRPRCGPRAATTSGWSARPATAAPSTSASGCLSGMFERNDDVLFVCYDNEGYMNTGVQRSGATPPAARTANTKADRAPSPATRSARARASR